MNQKDADQMFRNINQEKMVSIALEALRSRAPLGALATRCINIVYARLDELERRVKSVDKDSAGEVGK